MGGTGRRRFGDLPLFWKVLLPFLAVILLLGTLGTFFIVRDLAAEAQEALDRELGRRSLDVRSVAHDRELYLLEATNFASNINGLADAIIASDKSAVARLLGSVLALKADLALLAATDGRGVGMVEYRVDEAGRPARSPAGNWRKQAFVRSALEDIEGGKHSVLTRDGPHAILAIAAPVCGNKRPCRAAGVAIAAIRLDLIAVEAARAGTVGNATTSVDISFYSEAGEPLASSGAASPAPPADAGSAELVRRTQQVGDHESTTLYAPYVVQGRRVGTLAVSIPRDQAFAAVRGTAIRLVLVMLAAMAGVVAVGALLSRSILRQMRPLLETNRALGRGELSARAPVESRDEFGELARGANQMAEQLQASYETLELRVAQRTEEVRRLLSERTEFFAAMSHDFRTPLAAILSEADVMLDGMPAGSENASGLNNIKRSGEQLIEFVNEVLELARAEAGRLEMDLAAVRLGDLARDLRPTLYGLARAGSLRLSVELPENLPPVRADERRLREILLNLVDNAVKYTPAGGTVGVTASGSAGFVEVRVSDSGVGIPAEVGSRIFEPFYRVKGTSPARGETSTGLGLALTKRLVEAHLGDIWYTSEPGTGTTFAFTLPVAQQVTAANNGQKKAKKRVRSGARSGSRNG